MIRQEFVPPDWVDVTVRGVPPGTQQIYLVAEQADGVHALGWYESMVSAFVCSADVGEGWKWTSRYEAGERVGSVRWPNARRFGALLQAADRSWGLIWLGPDDLVGPSLSRYVFGDGKATVRVPSDTKGSIVSAEQAKQIGVRRDRD